MYNTIFSTKYEFDAKFYLYIIWYTKSTTVIDVNSLGCLFILIVMNESYLKERRTFSVNAPYSKYCYLSQ